MFLILTLAGLPNDLDLVRDQILASLNVPTVDKLFSRLVHLAAAPSHPVISSQTLDASILASQTVDNQASPTMENRRGGSRFGRSRPKCSYCHKLGHTHDVCYSLHARPPKNAYVAQTETTGNHGFSLSKGEYNEFLQYRASKQTSPQVAYVAQTDTSVAGNSFVCVFQFSTLGPWVVDSGASDHIFGNKSLLSNIVYSSSLPTVTLANGFQTKAKGVGQANPLPSVTLDSVLYVPGYPFSLAYVSHLTRSLHCGIYFIDDLFIMHDCSTGQTIGIGLESERLYYLNSLNPSKACLVTDPSDLIHRRLRHPSLSKLQKMVPSLSSLSTLDSSGITDSCPAPDPARTANLSLPSTSIALRKGIRTTLNPNLHYAMIDEMSALHMSGTWELVFLPSVKSIVGYRWVYTVKVGPDVKVDRLKARLVAKGYTHIFGLDYTDIKNIFLHGDLEDEVYMEQPPRFVAQGESRGLVCHLHRSLYGLKQSPRAWFDKFSTVIHEFGMTRSEVDHSVFYQHSASSFYIYLVAYVDDIVITGNDQDGITKLK
ncbi:uncharacterized protein [Nicotiana tomentosiformis]|uniref:uncharacterized protein n=1 Tax=Nicotiana tomentosiformis TaxID=4098 RepID=UPI00388CBB37